MNHFIAQRGLLVCIFIAGLIFLNGCNLIGVASSAALVKLQFGCLPSDAPIDTPTGPIQVSELQAGDLVIGYSGQPVQILQKHEYLEDAANTLYYRIFLSNGAEISTSKKHRIAGTAAENLEIGTQIAGHTILKIETFYGVHKSYDLLTQDQGYRIHGIPVNSMIEEMMQTVTQKRL